MSLNKQYSCDECHYFAISSNYLKRHSIQHHSKTNSHESEIDGESRLKTDAAFKKNNRSSYLKETFLTIDDQKSRCLLCKEILSDESYLLELHLKFCHAESFQKFSSTFDTEKLLSKATMATCFLCKKTVKSRDHSTTALRKHLNTWHLDQYETMMTEEGNDDSSSKNGNVNLPKRSKVWKYFEKVDDKAAIYTDSIPKVARKEHTKPNQSLVWQFFEKDATHSAKCKDCNKTVSTPGGTTSGLWKHMETKHGYMRVDNA